MAQAPTGIGKTIGTVFPLLKACPEQELDKVFFLSAKGSGRALALDAVHALRRSAPALPLRMVELVAREKACEHPDKACHGDSCPLARGFYDRLPAARGAAVARGTLTREGVREVAREHAACPYYLSQELVRWSDVVVGDYNYFFDTSALLHTLTLANTWRVVVAVDEAHNLVDRARAMYSAELAPADLRALRASAPAPLMQPLERLHRAWNALAKEQAQPYQVHARPPAKVGAALQNVVGSINELLAEDPQAADAGLLRFYFDALQFTRLLESFDTHSLFDVCVDWPGTRRAAATLGIRNVVPAPFLKPRFAAARSTVLFSATLTPQHFYADTLGLPDDTAWLDVEAPFDAGQLRVHIVRSVSTRWRDRGDSIEPIARLIARQYAAQPGNYLAFFSSFEYLQQVAGAFATRHRAIPIWQQMPRIDEHEREAFSAASRPKGRASASRCSGAPSLRASTCRAGA